MQGNVLQETLDVQVEKETYTFAIPTYIDEIKLGLQEREIRRDLERELFGPEFPATGEPTNDQSTDFLVRTGALFRVLLRKASAEWPWSEGPTNEPIIDMAKWPRDKVNTAVAVGVAFQAALRRFRDTGSASGRALGTEAVAGQPDTGADQPVRPGAAAP